MLMACLEESRRLYNEMLEQARDHKARTGMFLFKHSLASRFKGRGGNHVPASTVQALADRLDKALKRCILRKNVGARAGFPRFETPNRWHSIHLRQYGKGRDVRLEKNRLLLPARLLGRSTKVKRHRPLQGIPKTAFLKLRADGKWYVLIVCDLGDSPPRCTNKPTIGIDMGLKVFLTDSSGGTVANPRYYRKSEKKLRKSQRKMCRGKKGSNRRKKAARAVAKVHLKVARQRKDFLHQVTKRYAERYGTIVVEDLNVAGMRRGRTLAKSIGDASWSKFVTFLEYKAESAGALVVKVPPRFTTQACSRCGELVPKPLSVRTHDCASCGYVDDRDVNAAKNILKAGMRPSERKVKGRLELAPRS